MYLYLSAFADEAAEDFEEQLRVLNAERIPYIEIRGINGKNVADISEREAEECKTLLEKYGVRVWSIGSPLGKIGVSDDFKKHTEKAEHVFKIADILECKRVRMFSFYTDDPGPHEREIVSRLVKLVKLADRHGIALCHENEKGIYGDTAARCLNLLDNVRGLKCVYDPANFIQCGENAEAAHSSLRGRIDYYHIKDALTADGSVVPAGAGDGNISKIIGDIDLETVVLTLEPHLKIFSGYDNFDRSKLKNIYEYPTARAAFTAAADALRGLLIENGFSEGSGVWTK